MTCRYGDQELTTGIPIMVQESDMDVVIRQWKRVRECDVVPHTCPRTHVNKHSAGDGGCAHLFDAIVCCCVAWHVRCGLLQDVGYKAWKSHNLIQSQQFEQYAKDPEVLRLLDKVYGMTGIDKLAPKHSVKQRLFVAPHVSWLVAALFGTCGVLTLRATVPTRTGSS